MTVQIVHTLLCDFPQCSRRAENGAMVIPGLRGWAGKTLGWDHVGGLDLCGASSDPDDVAGNHARLFDGHGFRQDPFPGRKTWKTPRCTCGWASPSPDPDAAQIWARLHFLPHVIQPAFTATNP